MKKTKYEEKIRDDENNRKKTFKIELHEKFFSQKN